MTSRRALSGFLLVASIGAGLAVTCAPHDALAQPHRPGQPAPAPTPAPASGEPSDKDIQEARRLFQEAYDDEQAGRYDVALEKFRRVAQTKESVQVRYRIATCLEALHRLIESRDAYRACAAMRPSLPPANQPVADACAEKALAVDKKIPKLVVNVTGDNPASTDTRVTVDGKPVPVGRPIEQDPGEHTVQGNASGMKPFTQKVTLPDDGSQTPATVAFEPEKKDDGPPPPPPKSGGKGLGWLALIGGTALAVTGVALIVVREGVIDDINKLCPNPNACNPVNKPVVEDKTDTANLYLPLGIGLTAVGAIAAGFGVYTVFIKKSPDPQPAPAQGSAARIDIGPRYVRGGAMFGLSGAF